MSKDPAVLFYTSDFLTGTMLMSDEQVGRYMRLLCLQHQKGHLTEKDILKICGGERDEDIFEKFKMDENGLYYNKRMEKESSKRKAFVEGRKSNLESKNAHMDSHVDSHMEKHMESHMENENEDINTNTDQERDKGSLRGKEKPDAQAVRFAEFWAAYPRKVGKAAALKAWMKVKPSVELHARILEAVERQKQSTQWQRDGGQYIPHPTTWLNQGRWDDEPQPLSRAPDKPPENPNPFFAAAARMGEEPGHDTK